MKRSKMSLAYEIFQAFNFLGIAPEMFNELRQQFGGLEGLHKELENRICGN